MQTKMYGSGAGLGRRTGAAACAALALGAVALVGAIGVEAWGPGMQRRTATPFLKEGQAAMERMMSGMHAAPSGDTDRDFAAMMIAHHQGAIDMAMGELRHGRDTALRRIAQGIIVEQQQEIQAMQLALARLPKVPGRDAGLGEAISAVICGSAE